MGGGKRREPRHFSFPFPSFPAGFLFALSSPPYDTKRPLRRREVSKCPQVKLEDGENTNLGAFWISCLLSTRSFQEDNHELVLETEMQQNKSTWSWRQTSVQLSVRNDLLSNNYKELNNWRIHLRFMSSLPRISSCQDLWFQILLL